MKQSKSYIFIMKNNTREKKCSYKNVVFCVHRITKALPSCSGLRSFCRSLIIRPASENCFSTGDENRTRFFVLSCPVLLPTFVLAGGRTGQK